MKILRFLLLPLVLPLSLLAQSPQTQGPQWQENFRRWQELSPERREELKHRFEQLKSMSADQRRRFLEMAQRFRSLAPLERDKLRKRFELYRSLPPEHQEIIRKFVKRWVVMPPLQRQVMRNRIERLRAMSYEERERVLREHTPAWKRLNEVQRQSLRRFLFEKKGGRW